MTNSPQRPNYFELLELDPDQPWSVDIFDKALLAKQSEWGRPGPHDQRNARYREMIPAIKKVMLDDTLRSREAVAFKQARVAQINARRDKLKSQLQFITRGKQYILEEEFNRLAEDYKDIISKDNLREALTGQSVKISTDQVIESAKVTAIRNNLEVVGRRDLYHFLNESEESTTKALTDAAKAIYLKNREKATKTAQVTATGELARLATEMLKDEATRARYDNTLMHERFDPLFKSLLASVAANTDKLLNADQFEHLLEVAKQNDYPIRSAREYIQREAKRSGITVQLPANQPTAQPTPPPLLCPKCQQPISETDRACSKCGTVLKIKCPRCGKLCAPMDQYCSVCTFPFINRPAVEKALTEAEAILRTPEAATAIFYGVDLAQAWPGTPPHNDDDPISQHIENVRERARKAYEDNRKKLPPNNLPTLPPPSVQKLTARYHNGMVTLSWQPSSPAEKVEYVVMRKYGDPPSTYDECERLAVVTTTEFSDTKVKTSSPVTYIVVATQNGLDSKTSPMISLTVPDIHQPTAPSPPLLPPKGPLLPPQRPGLPRWIFWLPLLTWVVRSPGRKRPVLLSCSSILLLSCLVCYCGPQLLLYGPFRSGYQSTNVYLTQQYSCQTQQNILNVGQVWEGKATEGASDYPISMRITQTCNYTFTAELTWSTFNDTITHANGLYVPSVASEADAASYQKTITLAHANTANAVGLKFTENSFIRGSNVRLGIDYTGVFASKNELFLVWNDTQSSGTVHLELKH